MNQAIQQQNQQNVPSGGNGADWASMLQSMQSNLQANPQATANLQQLMTAMMSGTRPVDPSNPGKPAKPDSASMMMPLLMMPLVMGMGGGQGAERRAWAQPPRWWFQPPWWWNQPPWWFNQEPAWAANAEEEQP